MNTTDVVEALRYTYFNSPTTLSYLASQEVALWNMLKRKPMAMGGRGQAILPIRTRNAGVFKGLASEGATLTTRRSQPDTQEATFALQEFEWVVDLSWKALQDMRNDTFAFDSAFETVDTAFRVRMFRLMNADLLGYGRGELGILPATDDQTTVTVRALPLVDLGMIVDLMDATDNNALLIDAQPVTDLDEDNYTITTATSVSGSAAGDYFTVADTVATAGSAHMLGILNWLDTANPATVVGNIGGINRDTAGNGFWRSTHLTASANRPLTEDLLLQGFDAVRKKGGKPVNRLMSNLSLIRRYHEILREDTFFALSSPKEFGAGAGIGRDESGMKQGKDSDGGTIYRFSGVPWHAEPFFDANRLIGFNDEHFWIGHGQNEMPKPLSEIFSGQVPFFRQTTSATFDIVGYWQGELLSDNPRAGFQISALAES